MIKAIFCISATLLLSSLTVGTAQANTTNAMQRTFFNDQGQVIGESFLYCTNLGYHWGTVEQTNRDNVSVSFGCAAGGGVTVAYDIGVPAALRASFCSTYPVCTQSQPWPLPQQGSNPMLSGLWSN